jgi:hypothetical protein
MPSFLDKAKAAAEQAATRAKEGVGEVQAKRSLGHAYEELGRVTFELLESGEVSHPRLAIHAEEIRGLQSHGENPPPAAP